MNKNFSPFLQIFHPNDEIADLGLSGGWEGGEGGGEEKEWVLGAGECGKGYDK